MSVSKVSINEMQLKSKAFKMLEIFTGDYKMCQTVPSDGDRTFKWEFPKGSKFVNYAHVLMLMLILICLFQVLLHYTLTTMTQSNTDHSGFHVKNKTC